MDAQPIGYKFDGGFYADLSRRMVLYDNTEIQSPLLSAEFDVLLAFLKKPRTVIRRSETALGRQTNRRALDDYVSKIEKKLPVKGLFQTIRGVGYRFEADVTPVYETQSREGQELYKASELHFNLHRVDSMRHAVSQALGALERDPSSADAYITLAYSYISLSQAAFAAELPSAAIPKAHDAASRALSLSPNNARAKGILGLIALIYEYDWARGEELLQQALALNPGEVGTLLAYAHLLVSSGRVDRAFELIERAVRSDPSDMIVYASWGRIHLLGGDGAGAIDLGRQAVNIYPQLPPAHLLLGLAYETAGLTADAFKHYRLSLNLETSAFGLACLGYLYGKVGMRKDAQTILRTIEDLAEKRVFAYLPRYCQALIQIGLGENDKCLQLLRAAHDQRCDWLIHLGVEPRWSPIRKTSGFQTLMRKVGIPKH